MIHRGQILVRDCGPSRKSYSSDAIGTEFRHDYALVGIAEVDEHRYPEHFVRGFLQNVETAGAHFRTTDHYEAFPIHPGSDLGCLVRENHWPRPDPLFGIGGGGILFRDCRMTAPCGRKIVLVLAAASLPTGQLLNHHIYDFHGDVEKDGSFTLENPVDTEIMFGESLNALLKLPLWGWGKEKVGFVSTMDLPTIDKCMRYEELNLLDIRTPEQDAELEAINKGEVGWIFRSSNIDETYQAYRREMLKIRPNPAWDGVMSQSEQDADSVIASKILKQLLAA